MSPMAPKFVSITKDGLRVFRDDLYPFLGGGNKGRKMDAIAEDIVRKGADAVVTTGGIQSNHCRAAAVFSAQRGMRCVLVLHGSKEQFDRQSGNAKVMRLSGAEIVFAKEAAQIGATMDLAMGKFSAQGFNPYYLWGGGHTLEGGKAYIDAIKDLRVYCEQHDWWPSHIFHASGTGSTQSGILAGLDKYGIDTTVIGISVGRKSEQAQAIVRDFYHQLCSHYQITCAENPAIVLDDYLCGGYGLYNKEIEQISVNAIREHGFMLDTCYSAKAFYGMLDYIAKNRIDKNHVLFWHTGGIFNFLAE